MAERSLTNCKILVVEDEYMLASELALELEDAGAIVVGPVGSGEEAIELILSGQSVDGAIVDVNLRGEPAYPVADLLIERAVPFVFTTGYDASSLPTRFQDVARCDKPIHLSRVAAAIGRALHG